MIFLAELAFKSDRLLAKSSNLWLELLSCFIRNYNLPIWLNTLEIKLFYAILSIVI